VPVVELCKELIARPSVTPDEAGCHDLISQRLQKAGFTIESLPFKSEQSPQVENLWARRGKAEPLVVFAGHSDVVPTGPESDWTSPPFEPTVRDGHLYGRGATDMKSGVAASIIAAERFIEEHPNHPGSIGFLITSDEEGPSINGTKKVIDELTRRGEKIDYCIIGEASSEKQLGDQIRVGRRGSLHGKLIIKGKQGHIAYPVPGQNPIQNGLLALDQLAKTVWDKGNEYFPPTTFQISNIHAGTGALNVVPGAMEVRFNFRFSTALTVDELQLRVRQILNEHPIKYDLSWDVSGHPFLTKQGKLINVAKEAIQAVVGISPALSTGGGTSDGRFIAPTGAEVIELGPQIGTAHQIDEAVNIEELRKLPEIYQRILAQLLHSS